MPRIEAVLLAAVINMLVGAAWYSPHLLGDQWRSLIRKNERELKTNASTAYRASFVAALVTSYVLAKLMGYLHADDIWSGMSTGLWLWVGFVLTAFVPAYFFAKRPPLLLFIDSGYQLFALMAMA